MRRGLAVLAVGAMAALALPSTAFANTISQQQDSAGPGHATLYSLGGVADQASTKNDGQNTTISLLAGASSDIDTVRFQYSTDGGATWTNIGPVLTSRNDDGAFSYEWNPVADSGLTLPVAGVRLRANGHSSLDGLNHPGPSFGPLNVNNTFDTVAITPGSDLGVWKSNGGQDNVILNGTTSAAAGFVQVGVALPSGFIGANTTTTSTAGKWKTVLDIKPTYGSAPFGYSAPDQVAFTAFTSTGAPETSDGEAFTLYDQVITQISSSFGTVPDSTTPVAGKITVLDQKGMPIAGVNVSKNGVALGETDVNGQVATTQAVNDGAVQYVANVAGGSQTAYNPTLGDKETTVQLQSSYAADLVAKSADGPAFDFDEQDGDDVQVQVKDQNNVNFDVLSPTQKLTYHWTKSPFRFDETITGTSHTLGAEVNGLYDIPALSGADFSFGLESGTYSLYASLSEGGTGHAVAEKKLLTVKVGEAAVRSTSTQVPAGTTASVPAKLVLEDGTGLPGRKVDVSFVLGTEYNEHGIPTGTPDAVVVSNSPDTTDASGGFVAKVEDISHNPNQPEIGGKLNYNSAASSFGNWLGDANQAVPSEVAPYAVGVDFVATSAPAGSKMNIEYGAGAPASIIDPGDADTSGPAGSGQAGGLLLVDSANDPLVGVQVTLKLDHGFFVPVGAPNKAAAEGDYVPTPNSLGDTIKVVTGPNGRAAFNTSIGRDSGFDDDGHVTATVTGTISAATDSDTTDWNSAHPLNVSEISVVRTPAARQANPVNPAAKGTPVLFDVFAKDQFGNPAADVEVAVTCLTTSDAPCPSLGLPPAGLLANSDFDNGGDFTLRSTAAGTFNLVGTVNNIVTEKYNSALNPVAQTIKSNFSQEWYAIDFASSHFTIAATPAAASVPVGTPVTVTVKAIDQKGNPVPGLQVQFIRSGPGNQTGDPNMFVNTNQFGEAFYNFTGTQPGTAHVSAVISDGVHNQTLTKDIVFGRGPITAHLRGFNNGAAADHLTVDAPARAKGATVKLFRINRNGSRTAVGLSTLDSSGNHSFVVRDRNGSRITKYVAKVMATSVTNGDMTNVKRVR